jgi:hypothetical protein
MPSPKCCVLNKIQEMKMPSCGRFINISSVSLSDK